MKRLGMFGIVVALLAGVTFMYYNAPPPVPPTFTPTAKDYRAYAEKHVNDFVLPKVVIAYKCANRDTLVAFTKGTFSPDVSASVQNECDTELTLNGFSKIIKTADGYVTYFLQFDPETATQAQKVDYLLHYNYEDITAALQPRR